MRKKILSLISACVFLTLTLSGGLAQTNNPSTEIIESFVRQQIFRQYSLFYDTFNAAIVLENGEEITGIGFTDYSSYYEAGDGSGGYFPAGFVADYAYEVPELNNDNIYIIDNLDFTDEKYQFVYDCETVPFISHFVRDGLYVKYGVNEHNTITYETNAYARELCDESIGALYSYDENRFLLDSDVGNYARISGNSLSEFIDYKTMEAQVNEIIAEQNDRFSEQEIITNIYIAKEAVVSYLLSRQQESFLGYSVTEMIDYASRIDPMEFVRITPDGMITIQINDEFPEDQEKLTKWLVGIGCGIFIVASTALNMFVPFTRPICGAVTAAAFEAFTQVVLSNKSWKDIQWEKVAIAVASGAVMAWALPLAASGITGVVARKGGETLGKLAGYGVLTIGNSMTSGIAGYLYAKEDGYEGWDALKQGLLIGACGTAFASVMAEAMPALGSKVSELLQRTKFGSAINKALSGVNKAVGEVDLWIRGKQVHIKGKLSAIEDILSPKSIHQAAENAWREMNNQTGASGGRYSDLTNPGDGSINKHEMPSYEAYNNAMKTESARGELPSIKMSAEDHMQTASWGRSKEAIQYRTRQAELIASGNMRAAIQMDIDDVTSKFGTKYNEGIQQMLDYARTKGWW